MPDDGLQVLIDKTDAILGLLALLLADGRKQADQIALLSRAGLRPKQIAQLLGTTPNTVSVALSTQRRRGSIRPPLRPAEQDSGGET